VKERTRLKFLAIMGIEVWVPRDHCSVIESELLNDHVLLESLEKERYVGASDSRNWQVLTDNVTDCRRCTVCQNRVQALVGEGNSHADLMFIGGAPDETEDQLGAPFVGQSGQLLTEMIRAMGWAREAVYLTNIIKCKIPEERDPTQSEVNECLVYLEQQIKLVQPKVILAVGEVAAKALLATDSPLSQLSGKIHYRNEIPLVAILHPAYLLREPLEKRKTWLDLQVVLNCLKNGVN